MKQSIEERMEDTLQDKANLRFKEFLNSDPTINRNIWPNGAVETIMTTPIELGIKKTTFSEVSNSDPIDIVKLTCEELLRNLEDDLEYHYWNNIVDLVFKFPNDMELGGEVRKYVNLYYK